MVIPAYLNYVYFDFFSDHQAIWWRQDTFFIDKFFSPIYSVAVPLQISDVYFNGLEGNPNAGMFAEAVSRCGYWGIFIYPILICLLIQLLDRSLSMAAEEVKFIFAVCIAMGISNDVITSTSFVLVLIILLIGTQYFSENRRYYNA